ncbi:MAG: hypothetical protein M1834_008562 [Cirrosporium novae-zelandiae]|nr:MAG: hypothetical protein M1834_008562 [Cirrosporium novae-zelandiae]
MDSLQRHKNFLSDIIKQECDRLEEEWKEYLAQREEICAQEKTRLLEEIKNLERNEAQLNEIQRERGLLSHPPPNRPPSSASIDVNTEKSRGDVTGGLHALQVKANPVDGLEKMNQQLQEDAQGTMTQLQMQSRKFRERLENRAQESAQLLEENRKLSRQIETLQNEVTRIGELERENHHLRAEAGMEHANLTEVHDCFKNDENKSSGTPRQEISSSEESHGSVKAFRSSGYESNTTASPSDGYHRLSCKYNELRDSNKELQRAFDALCKKNREYKDVVKSWQAWAERLKGKEQKRKQVRQQNPTIEIHDQIPGIFMPEHALASDLVSDAKASPAFKIPKGLNPVDTGDIPALNPDLDTIDIPEVVSSRKLKRKRPTPTNQAKVQTGQISTPGTDNNGGSIQIKEEPVSSPLDSVRVRELQGPQESIDLDAFVDSRATTPKKRRRVEKSPSPTRPSTTDSPAPPQPLVPNQPVSQSTAKLQKANHPTPSEEEKRREAALLIYGESGDENASDIGPKRRNAPKKMPDMLKRLNRLLEGPSPEKSPLSLGSIRIPRAKNLEGSKSPQPIPRAKGNDVRGRDEAVSPGAIDVTGKKVKNTTPKPSSTRPSRGHEARNIPLRDKPVDQLALSDFKPNPNYNQGLDFVFTEVVRKHDERKKLPGTVRPEFLKMAELGQLPPDMETTKSKQSRAAEDDILHTHLGLNYFEIRGLSPDDRRRHLLDAQAKEYADKFGRQRQAYERAKSPEGFWNVDFPTTQEEQESREAAEKREREEIEKRAREARKGAGAWVFRDEF